jgi:hypothetical protein
MNEPEFISLPNRETITLSAGCPVANSVDGNGFVRAVSGVNLCVGLLTQDVHIYSNGQYQVGGVLILPDWTAIIGTSKLAPDSIYYTSVTPGKLTVTAPATPQIVGTSLSPTALSIEIEQIASAGGLVGDLDGGTPTSIYGGVDPVDGGGP